MTGAEWINWATNLATVAVSSGIVVTLLQKIFNRKLEAEDRERKEKDDKRQEERAGEERDRRRREADDLLAESRAIAQRSALESANSALQVVREQCADCTARLTASEQRERKLVAVLRTIIRGLDANDPTRIDVAVATAKELI